MVHREFCVVVIFNILDTVIVTQNQLYFSRTPHIVVTNARGSSESSCVVVILNSNTIDTLLTENPFLFSRTPHIVVTNSRGSQRVHVLL